MKRRRIFLAALGFSLVMAACVSAPNAPEPESQGEAGTLGFWKSMPGQELVFIGGANLRSNREESVNLALLDIARRVSIFQAVEGEFASYTKTGSSFFDYRSDTESSLYFDEDYLGFVESLEYDPVADVVQVGNSIFVRARFKGSPPLTLHYDAPPGAGGRPLWVDSPPEEISGHRVGVGYAARRSSHRDTVNLSFEAAIFSIIRTVSGHVSSGAVNYQGPGRFDYRSTNDSTVRTWGKLEGFYVLEIWMDPSTMGVWTLAIARTSEAGEG
jgi:hypothetical protein